jgi:hypothetical protein
MNISTCDRRIIPNIFAYSETRSRDLTVPLIGEEQVSTVAKPELKVAVIISGIFRYINKNSYAQTSSKNSQNRVDNGKIRLPTHKQAHVHCILL